MLTNYKFRKTNILQSSTLPKYFYQKKLFGEKFLADFCFSMFFTFYTY